MICWGVCCWFSNLFIVFKGFLGFKSIFWALMGSNFQPCNSGPVVGIICFVSNPRFGRWDLLVATFVTWKDQMGCKAGS